MTDTWGEAGHMASGHTVVAHTGRAIQSTALALADHATDRF